MKYLLIIILLVLVSGCIARPAAKSSISDPIKRTVIEKIYETNWLVTLFIVGIAAGVFAIVRGAIEFGVAAVVSSIAGLVAVRIDQTLSTQTWPWIVAGIIILVATGAFLYRIGKMAFREKLKGTGMSRSSEKLVAKYKEKL